MSIDNLFETLFTHSDFIKKYWKVRKLENPQVNEWEYIDSKQTRIFQFNVDAGAFGMAKNKDTQVNCLILTSNLSF